MRVEGQGMATDYYPAKVEGNRTEGKKVKESEKISPQDLNFEQRQNPENLKVAIDTANKALKISNRHLQFRLHEDSGRYQVKVIDSNTDEVVREIPSESVLAFAASIKQMLDEAVGILVDEIV